MKIELTPASKNLLQTIADAAEMSNDGLGAWASWFRPITKDERGNVSDLIKKGLLTVGEADIDGEIWYQLTEEAKKLVGGSND